MPVSNSKPIVPASGASTYRTVNKQAASPTLTHSSNCSNKTGMGNTLGSTMRLNAKPKHLVVKRSTRQLTIPKEHNLHTSRRCAQKKEEVTLGKAASHSQFFSRKNP